MPLGFNPNAAHPEKPTGARRQVGDRAKVLGLEVDDVRLERETVTIRPNARQRLKTVTSHRSIPLSPMLAEILRGYFPRREQSGVPRGTARRYVGGSRGDPAGGHFLTRLLAPLAEAARKCKPDNVLRTWVQAY